MSNEAPTDALRLVPVEPTREMIEAGMDFDERVLTLRLGRPPTVEECQIGEWQAILAAAPASPLPGGGWQDISTAPKDGTEVLVMLKPKVIRLGWYFKPSSRTEGWCDENGKRIIPSHWMPLPAAPTGDA